MCVYYIECICLYIILNVNVCLLPVYREAFRLPIVLCTKIDQTLVNSLHGLLNCEIGGLDCRVITTEYRTRVHCIHMYHLLCKTLVHVIHSAVSGQCSHTIITDKLLKLICPVCKPMVFLNCGALFSLV